MEIGIIIGAILGAILLIISLIGFFVSKRQGKSSRLYKWVALAGVCALLTAGANALKLIL